VAMRVMPRKACAKEKEMKKRKKEKIKPAGERAHNTGRRSGNKNEIVLTGGCFDCGGKCLYKVHLRDGVPIRIEPNKELKACARGYGMLNRMLSPERLKHPLQRVGPRGYNDSFKRISWEKALNRVAEKLKHVKERYGNEAIFPLTTSGSPGRLYSPAILFRLLNKIGGCTMRWGSYSGEAAYFAGKITYGTHATENTRDDLMNSRLIIMWGWNPANTIWGTGTSFHICNAKNSGARFIAVDPRLQDSAAVWADKWIPIRPGTDAAMLVSMAYVILQNDLQDQGFLDAYTIGFGKYRSYVLGEDDGIPKTTSWAEKICGVQAHVIEDLAYEYANTKPAALLLGFSPGRTAYGEQTHRAAAVLACMTGNVGKSGGSAGNSAVMHIGVSPGPTQPAAPSLIPSGSNPLDPKRNIVSLDPNLKNKSFIHVGNIWDAVLKGKRGGYPADIKFIWVMFANPLNQASNTNKGVKAIEGLDFMVVNDQFMTTTARYADIVLPVSSHWERDDYARPWLSGDYHLFCQKVINPPGEARSDLWIVEQIASRLGINDFLEGKKEEDWLKYSISTAPEAQRDLPDLEAFKEKTVVYHKIERPVIAFKAQIEDFANNPFSTKSGKIEIYSQQLADMNDPRIPPIPKYIEHWEGVNDPLAVIYPLQLISFHSRSKAHAAFEFSQLLRELEPHVVWINSQDAKARGIMDGERVKVFNQRGAVSIQAYLTERIMPGVVAIGEGACFWPDENGIDQGANPNTLIRDQGSPGGAFVTGSTLVEIERL
jgi:anaerobic dimethyl sulfoxide reductase subunit A